MAVKKTTIKKRVVKKRTPTMIKKSIDNPVDDPNPHPDVVDENLDNAPDSPDKDYTVDFVDEHLDDVTEENEHLDDVTETNKHLDDSFVEETNPDVIDEYLDSTSVEETNLDNVSSEECPLSDDTPEPQEDVKPKNGDYMEPIEIEPEKKPKDGYYKDNFNKFHMM